MYKLITVQKQLEEALLMLCENSAVSNKKRLIYEKCISHVRAESIPHCIRKDYYHLLTCFDESLVAKSMDNFYPGMPGGAPLEMSDKALATAILVLLLHLNQWVSIEN